MTITEISHKINFAFKVITVLKKNFRRTFLKIFFQEGLLLLFNNISADLCFGLSLMTVQRVCKISKDWLKKEGERDSKSIH